MSSFDSQPLLTGSRVILRSLAPSDWDALYAVASDPGIWAGHPAHDRWQASVFRAYFDDALASGGGLIALDPATGAVLGASRYDHFRASPGEVEIGWTFVARTCWGKGINPAMKRLMVEHAHQHYDRAIFVIGQDNMRSRTAIERLGATLTGRDVQATMAGQPVRHVIYAIDRASYAETPLARTPV